MDRCLYLTNLLLKKTLSDSMSNEEKAIELITQAEKKVKSSQGFLGGLFG